MPRSASGAIAVSASVRRCTDASRSVAGRELGQKAARAHRIGIQSLAGQENSLRRVDTESRDIALEAAAVVVQAEPRGRHEHLRGMRADAEIAGEREIGSASVRAAVDDGDGHRARRLDGVGHVLESDRIARLSGETRNVVAAAEILAFTADMQHEHARIGVDGGEMTEDRLQIIRPEAVCAVGPPQGERCEGMRDIE